MKIWVTRNHAPFHEVAPGAPLLNVLEITTGHIVSLILFLGYLKYLVVLQERSQFKTFLFFFVKCFH